MEQIGEFLGSITEDGAAIYAGIARLWMNKSRPGVGKGGRVERFIHRAKLAALNGTST